MPPAGQFAEAQIVINVVDGTSGEVVSRVVKNLDRLGDAGSNSGRRAAQGLTEFGSAGENAGRRAARGMDEVGGHALTALDNVRLLRDDLGIRIPRAMESVIARSQMMSGAIAAAGQAFVALGAAELVFHIGEEVYDLYKKWVDTTRAVKDYEIEAGKAAKQKLFEDGSFDRQMGLLQGASSEIDQLIAKKKAYDQQSIVMKGYDFASGKGFTTSDDEHLADAMARQNQAEVGTLQKSHQLMLQNIDDIERRRKASATAAGAIQIEREAMRQRNKENLSFAQEMDTTLVDQINRAHDADPKKFHNVAGYNLNAGQAEYGAAEQSADSTQRGAATQLAIQQEKELMDLRHQADQAGLEGGRLLQTQRVAALEDLSFKWRGVSIQNKQYAAEEAALNQRFDNEELKRIQEQADALRKRNQDAGLRGLTGLAASDRRAANERTDVDTALAGHRYYGDRQQQEEYASGLKSAIDRGASQDSQKQIDDFTQRVRQMDASRADSSMTANQRIAADTARTVAEIMKAWNDLYGQLQANDPRRVQGQQALDAELKNIYASQADQQKKVRQDLADQTKQLQGEAARGGGGDRYAEQYRAVESELQVHLQKVAELEDAARKSNNAADLANLELLEQQKQAYQQIAYNKELDLARQQRDRLAGELRGYFSNPLEALKRSGEDIASKAAADLLMGNLPGKTPSGKGGSGVFDLFRPAFKRNGGVAGSVAPDATVTPSAPQQAVVNATSAVINVTSATFSGAAAVAGGGYVPTGNGGYFNLGGSSEAGRAASAGTPWADSFGGTNGFGGASATDAPVHAPASLGAPYIPSGPVMTESTADAAHRIYGGATSAAKQADSIGKDLGIFGKDANGKNAGLLSKVPGLKNMDSAQLAKLGGTAGGALGVFSAFEGKGGFGGAATGALSGFQMGAQYGGVLGGAVGALVGGVLGFMGHGARVQAQNYWFKELQPKIQAEMLAFGAGTADYQSVYDDLNSSDLEAKQRTKQMGSGAVGYYDDRIHPEIQKYMQTVTREQKAGRSQFGMSAGQFHQGGLVGGFGSMATSSNEGWIHAKRGEVVLNEQAAMSHGDVAMMMNSGASRSQIGDYLGGGGGGGVAPAAGGDEYHFHLHALDTSTAEDWMMSNKHGLRKALNSSYEENSGGWD